MDRPARPPALPAAARLKVHLRLLHLADYLYRLVTLRAATDVVYSTNYYHNTWHLLSDRRGAHLLARLLWGLSYQRHPGILVLLHGRHLRPTPFDAAPSDPVLLIPAGLTPFRPEAFRQLKARLGSLHPPRQTIRWHTFGLDAQLLAQSQGTPTDLDRARAFLSTPAGGPTWQAEKMTRCGGFICYSAPPAILRQQAFVIHSLDPCPMDYHFLALLGPGGGADGEVQVFADYRERLAAATVARREVLACPDHPTDPDALVKFISRRGDVIRDRRRKARRIHLPSG
jgi:hypothetical protein